MGIGTLAWLTIVLALLCFGVPQVAVAVTLEMIAAPEAIGDENTPRFVRPQDQVSLDNPIASVLPNLMPLYAGTEFVDYARADVADWSTTRDDWSTDNGKWLNAMLPTLIQVRRKEGEELVQLHDRQLQREARLRLAPRAGRPTIVNENEEEGPQLGIRVSDILMRYAHNSQNNVAPHYTDGEMRDANPFEVEEVGGLGTILLLAEVDIATAERIDSVVTENEAIIATTVRVAQLATEQINRLDNGFKDWIGAGSLEGGLHGRGPIKSLIPTTGAGGEHALSRSTRPTERKDISLASFLVNLGLSVGTSPITYLVALPLLLGWMLIRIARASGS